MPENYIQRAHKQIQIESWSNSARTILLRGYSEDGPFAELHVTNADRSRAVDTFEVHGDPLGVTVRPLAVPVRRGECYVRVTLLLDGEPVKRLMAAYVTDGKTLSWPPGVHEGFTDGDGLIRLITGANPAAGAEISQVVEPNTRWRLIDIRFILVTDATVTNRRSALVLDDGTTVFFQKNAGAVQAASATRTYTFASGLESETGFTETLMATGILDDVTLFQGWRIRTATVNLQAGDDYAAPVMTVEEWIEE